MSLNSILVKIGVNHPSAILSNSVFVKSIDLLRVFKCNCSSLKLIFFALLLRAFSIILV